jgi:hypothetical protein
MNAHHEIILIPVWDLKPYENNARTHSDEQVEQLTKSIKQFGFNNPILVQDDLTVVAGHGRLLAAKKLGLEKVPVIKLKHLSKEQVKAYVLADNKLALNAGWDDEILKAELLAIQEAGEVDMEAIGFSDEEMKALIDGVEVEDDTEKDRAEYTKKIDTPVYSPKGDKPELHTLVDLSKASQIISKIQAADIPEDEKRFLINAAYRHNVFDYHAIAEYYCHSSPVVQDLMEQSALVIIDFNKAIELGYVQLSKKLEGIYSESYEDVTDDEA